MSKTKTMVGRAAIEASAGVRKHAPWTAAVTTVLIAFAGWITSQGKHDDSAEVRREMHMIAATKDAEQDAVIKELVAKIVKLQIGQAVLEDRWESEGEGTISTVDWIPPPPPPPRARSARVVTYDDLLRKLGQLEQRALEH